MPSVAKLTTRLWSSPEATRSSILSTTSGLPNSSGFSLACAAPGAQQHRLTEAAVGQTTGEHQHDAAGAGRLYDQRHALRVATEGPDIVLHPVESCDLIREAKAGCWRHVGVRVRIRQKSEDAEPIVERHHDGAAPCQFGAVEHRQRTRAEVKGAPPWIQTITGSAASEPPGAQTFRKRQSSFIDASDSAGWGGCMHAAPRRGRQAS